MRPAFLALALLAAAALGPGCTCARAHDASGTADAASTSTPSTSSSQASTVLDRESDGSPAMKCPDELIYARRGGSDENRYVVPDDGERAALTDAIGKLAADPAANPAARHDAETRLTAIGFEVVDIASLPGAVIVREVESRRRGGGAYLIRLGSTSRLAVQTPHTFFDEGTLPLGCELFARTGARALFVETAHRYKAAEATEDGEHPADVAHQSDSLFQAATSGLLGAGVTTFVQLHGFTLRKPNEIVVLSSGAKVPGDALVERARDALAPVLKSGGHVARFPADTLDFGATTNVQGALVRSKGARFLHVEMDSRLRKDLNLMPDYRGRFLLALASALGAT
jgi:hypothetical protein